MSLKSALLLAAMIVLGMGFQGCNSVKPIDKSKLAGYWSLKSLNGQNAGTEFEGPIPSIEFDFEKNLISGSGGCNRYHGGFTLSNENVFSAPNLASTMMMCVVKNKEPEFLQTLSSEGLVISLTPEELLTFTKGGKTVLQFEKGEAPVEPKPQLISMETLTGTWTLESMPGEDVSALFSEKKPTLELADEGKAHGLGGCNNYRTTYTLEGNTISFGPVMSTKMACPSLEGEGKFISLLEGPAEVSVVEGKLIFKKDGKIIFEFTKMP